MNQNEAMLLAAERDLKKWLARARAHQKIDASSESIEPMWDEVAKQVEFICKTPPSSLIAAAVKLRIVIHPELGIEEEENSENMLALRQVLALINHQIDRRSRARRSSAAVVGPRRRRLRSTNSRRATAA
jgi:hypothetical protein